MFRPPFATLLSSLLVFSCLVVGFPATAAMPSLDNKDGVDSKFKPLPKQQDIPPALLQTLQGQKEPLSNLVKTKLARGPVLLHLWSPRCQPCVTEMQELEVARLALEKEGIGVLAIAQDYEGAVSVPAFMRRYSLSNPEVYIDQLRAAALNLETAGLPSTYLISPEGKVVAVHTGAMQWLR